jgi:DNA-binding LytR/AlgR family response regulator
VTAQNAQAYSGVFFVRLAQVCRNHWRSFLVAVIAALFMSAIGAFQSARLPLFERTLYWLAMMVIGTFLGTTLMTLMRGLSFLDDRPWLQSGVFILLMWAPVTAMVSVVVMLMAHTPWSPGIMLENAGPVLLVCAAMVALNNLADREPAQTHAAAKPNEAAPPAFLQRLPIRLQGADLYAVEAQDHYLRLHTSKGMDLILLRLSEAIGELEGIEGAQTHRSWWVAKDGVDEARRGDGRGILRLKDGAEVPVSRTYVRALRQAGWF